MPGSHPAAPRTILLATDLSCRCDRPLDRATSLAAVWGARLVVASIVAPDASVEESDGHGSRRRSDTVEAARRLLRRDTENDAPDVTFRIEEGTSVSAGLLAIAREEGCDLIVTGVAKEGLLERMILGTTVNQLVRRAATPVLMVRNRVHRPYRSVIVATDFSEASGHALATAAAYFPEAAITALHGYEPPFGALGEEDESLQRLREMEIALGPRFLGAAPLDDAARTRIGLQIAHGSPERVVWDYVRDHDVDLTVVASHGRSRAVHALIGSTTARLLESAETDVLVVMDPHLRRGEAGA